MGGQDEGQKSQSDAILGLTTPCVYNPLLEESAHANVAFFSLQAIPAGLDFQAGLKGCV